MRRAPLAALAAALLAAPAAHAAEPVTPRARQALPIGTLVTSPCSVSEAVTGGGYDEFLDEPWQERTITIVAGALYEWERGKRGFPALAQLCAWGSEGEGLVATKPYRIRDWGEYEFVVSTSVVVEKFYPQSPGRGVGVIGERLREKSSVFSVVRRSSCRATVTAASGPVQVEGAPPRIGSRVLPGDRVETGRGGRVEFVFGGGSLVRLGGGTQAELAFAECDAPSGRVRSFDLLLFVGNVWARITRLVGGEVTVETSRGATGVRGTTFEVSLQPPKYVMRVRVLDGKVAVEPKKGAALALRGGQCVDVGLAGAGRPRAC